MLSYMLKREQRKKIADTAGCGSAPRQVDRGQGERSDLLNFSMKRSDWHETGKTHVATRSHVPLRVCSLRAKFRTLFHTCTITHGSCLSLIAQRCRPALPRQKSRRNYPGATAIPTLWLTFTSSSVQAWIGKGHDTASAIYLWSPDFEYANQNLKLNIAHDISWF